MSFATKPDTFAYEMRLQILSMALDIHREALQQGTNKTLNVQEILETARTMNEFISEDGKRAPRTRLKGDLAGG